QLVVRRVVLDLVDPVAVAVMGAQDRLVAIGELAPALRLPAAGQRPEFGDLVEAPLAALADQRLGQYGRCRGVVVLQRRYLIGDDMRVWHATMLQFSDSRTRDVISSTWRCRPIRLRHKPFRPAPDAY